MRLIDHHTWLLLHDALGEHDAELKRNPQPGDSVVAHREQSRLIATSQPYANAWVNMVPDGTTRTRLSTKQWRAIAQRRVGLHLSATKKALAELHDAGESAADYLGDAITNAPNKSRRHHGGLHGWYDAAVAVATSSVVLGDKENEAAVEQFCAGAVTDLVEIGAGDEGEDVCNEFKAYTSLSGKGEVPGRGTARNGGSVAKVGHRYAFGNQEEAARLDNLGCEERGRQRDGAFDHATGKGWVKARKGKYHDALHVKKNIVCLLIHDPNGGGFNNVAAVKIRRLGRQARRTGVDRTKYAGRRQISFVTHHTQQITAGIVRNEAINIEIAANKIKGDLYKYKIGLERGA